MKNKSGILYLNLCRPWIPWSYFGNWPIIKNIFTIKYPLIADFKIYYFLFYHFILKYNLLTYKLNNVFEKISNHKSENLVMGCAWGCAWVSKISRKNIFDLPKISIVKHFFAVWIECPIISLSGVVFVTGNLKFQVMRQLDSERRIRYKISNTQKREIF